MRGDKEAGEKIHYVKVMRRGRTRIISGTCAIKFTELR